MRNNGNSGNVADASCHPGLPSAPSAESPVLTIILPGHLTPSLNTVNAMHWTKKARLRKHYRDLLEGSVSPLNAMLREPLTVIIFGEDASS